MKPRLEGLEDRLVPSAPDSTPPAIAETTAPLVSMMNQWNQVLVTLEKDVSNLEETFNQEIAQLLAYVEYQVDQLFGIDTNTSPTSSNAVVPPASSSSGSRNGSSNANLGPIANQDSDTMTDGGSGNLSPSKPRTAANLQVQPLDSSREDTDGSGTVTGPLGGYIYGELVFNKATINGDAGGPASAFSGGGYYVYSIDSEDAVGGTCQGSGTLGDGTNFGVSGGEQSYICYLNGNSINGDFQASGTNSEDDDIEVDGTFQGTVDDNGYVTGGTYTISTFTVNEPPPNNDTLIWNPVNGNNASTEQNWFDQTRNKQGVEAPTASNPVIFDGTAGSQTSCNFPITWDAQANATVASITLQNGYNALMTINSGIKVEDAGTFTEDAASNLNLNFLDSTSKFQLDNNATITNMQLGGNSGGQFIINGGTTMMAQAGGYTESLGVQFIVYAGATVNYQSYNTLTLTANNVTITDYGTIKLFYGTGNGIALIDGGAQNPNDYIDVSGGFLGYYGRQNVEDTITVPIAIHGGGTFKVSVATDRPVNGWLVVEGGNASTNNVSVYLAGALSSIQLDHSDYLECDNGYYQASGTLETTDASTCQLYVLGAGGVGGTATVAGGSLIINQPNTGGYGKLSVLAATLNFNGALEPLTK